MVSATVEGPEDLFVKVKLCIRKDPLHGPWPMVNGYSGTETWDCDTKLYSKKTDVA